MYNNLMIDIETMGLGSDSAIIQIAAVPFSKNAQSYDKDNIFSRYIRISPDNCVVENHTLSWWLRQDFAQQMGQSLENGEYLDGVLEDFLNYVVDIINIERLPFTLWAKNIGFDFRLLSHAFNRVDKNDNWDCISEKLNVKCAMKVFKKLTGSGKGPNLDREGLAHDALSDCIYQIEQLKHCVNKYNVDL